MKFDLPATKRVCAAVAAAAVNAWILWTFHDRHWYPSDEGIYAHIAERLLAGEVMNRDVQNFHPGYVDFLNAAALRAFGMDLLSLRYPLVAVAFIQALVVYRLLARQSLLLGVAGSIAVTALGVVQFLNPTPNWYCLSLSIVLVSWMISTPREQARRLIVAGFLIGLVGLFRQLTGVWLAFGVLAAILRERSSSSGSRGLLAPSLLLLVLASLLIHLTFSKAAQLGGVLLFSAAPLAITGALLWDVRARDRDVAVALLQLCVGGLIAAVPLIAYWVLHGSFWAWLNDVVIEAAQFAELPFLGGGSWYAALPVAALYQAVSSWSLAGIVNGFYWSTVSLLAIWNGVLTLRRLRSSAQGQDLTLPIVAAFYGLVAMFMENAIYLHFTAGMSLCSILWLNASAGRPTRVTSAVVSAALAIIAIVYHAGQSSAVRTGRELLGGMPSRSAYHVSAVLQVQSAAGSGGPGTVSCRCGRHSPRNDVRRQYPGTSERRDLLLPRRSSQSDPLLQLRGGNLQRRDPRRREDDDGTPATEGRHVQAGRQVQYRRLAGDHGRRPGALRPGEGAAWGGDLQAARQTVVQSGAVEPQARGRAVGRR